MKKAFFITLVLLVITIAMLFFLNKDEIKLAKSEGVDILTEDSSNKEKEIKITFLDIGQGDASFIEWPNGEQMLVDCSKDARILGALGRAMEYYDKRIDYLLVTHPDLDHYGGCTDVLKRFDVDNIIYTGLNKNDKTWNFFWKTAQEEGAKIYEIDSRQEMHISNTVLDFIYPDHNLSVDRGIPGVDKETSDNNASIVFKLSYGENGVLFTGDMEEDLEEYLVDNYGDQIEAELLKVGHHGSNTSSGQGFLDLVDPEVSIISVGKDNQYGHPSRRVIKRLERENSDIWRTDLQGDIILYLDLKSKKGYTIDYNK